MISGSGLNRLKRITFSPALTFWVEFLRFGRTNVEVRMKSDWKIVEADQNLEETREHD